MIFDNKQKQEILDVLSGKKPERELNSIQYVELLNMRREAELNAQPDNNEDFLAWWSTRK